MGKHRARDLLWHFADRHRDYRYGDRVGVAVLVASPHGRRYSDVGTAGDTHGRLLPDVRGKGIHGVGSVVHRGFAVAGRRPFPCSGLVAALERLNTLRRTFS